ncbi:GtrA family protein [Nocardia carnea]|uniref:GtrA family protein n=1 Tax=Nocardia carnea TaxID=37328 RepID=A0ABW7TQ28_9NOCA|nr:GtrA family protein [Nocardia carnea]
MTSEHTETPAHGAGHDGIAREHHRPGDHEEPDRLSADSRHVMGSVDGVQFPKGPETSGGRPVRVAAEWGDPPDDAVRRSGVPAALLSGTGAGRIRGDGRGALLRLVRRREIAFAMVGVVNTVMGIGLTVAWLAVLGESVPPSVGVVAAYCTGIGVAFVLHRRLVFRVRGRVLRDFLGFAAVNCGGLVANAVLLEVAVNLFGFPRALSAVVVMGAVAAGTFFGHQYISFRRPAV